MALSKSGAISLVGDQLWEMFTAERDRLEVIDKWARGKQPDPWKPRSASSEYRALMEKSKTPFLPLVVKALVQIMYVDGYRSPKSEQDAPAWAIWQANGWDSRQIPLNRSTFNHGLAYVTVLPGTLRGQKMPVARGVSARNAIAVYRDPAEDEWPEFFLRATRSGRDWMLKLYDEDIEHTLSIKDGTDKPEYIEPREHEMPEVPAIRFVNELDLEGRAIGEVEPHIGTAARIDQVTFDRLMVERYLSWKVRTVTGMAKPETTAEETAKKVQLAQDDLLVASNPATKFGTLPETPMEGFIKAGEFEINTLGATSQTPSQYLSGNMTNLSADALALVEATLMRKRTERQTTIGEAHEQWLRLAGAWQGIEVDDAAQVKWRDVESRSLAQMADALGKIASQLNFPAQILWEKIPGLTQTDIEEAKRLIESGDSLQQLMDELDRQSKEPADVDAGAGA